MHQEHLLLREKKQMSVFLYLIYFQFSTLHTLIDVLTYTFSCLSDCLLIPSAPKYSLLSFSSLNLVRCCSIRRPPSLFTAFSSPPLYSWEPTSLTIMAPTTIRITVARVVLSAPLGVKRGDGLKGQPGL